MPAADESTGQRIARYRKLRGLTQRGLATRSNVGYGTLTKVESGHALASAAVVAALARALSVNVAALTGQPFLDELRAAQVDQLIEPLRVSLDRHDLPPAEDVAPRPVEEISSSVTVLCDEAMIGGHSAKAAAELPGLIDELAAVVAEHGDEQAWRTLAAAYRCVRHVVLGYGFRDLADIALDRATWAGIQAGDPLAEATRHRARASNHLRAGAYETGRYLLDATLADVADAPPGRRRDVLAGHTHLGWAVNAARAGDLPTARGHIDEAEHLAELTGEAAAVGWYGFGPTNVAIHKVAVLIEAGKAAEAVAAAATLEIPSDWSATRAGHHHMDLARAHAWLGQHDAALRDLVEARRLAPEQTRFHPTTRQTVEYILGAKRRIPEPFASYARWIGL